MYKTKSEGITLVALVVTIIILLILVTISVQALTSTGLFENANKAKLETKRSQIKEWLSLNLMQARTTSYDKTDSEILEVAREKAEESEELKKLGKSVSVDGELSTEKDGQTVPTYFYVIVDNDVYKTDIKGAKSILEQLESREKIRLLIFPEGGIFKENYKYNKRKTKSGAVYLSAIANVPIIPVHITVRPKFFSTVTVTFGDAIFPDKAVLKNKKLLKENATKLINQIYDIN